MENAHVSQWNVCGCNEALSRQARLLADDQAGEWRQSPLRAMLLNRAEKVAEAGAHKAGKSCNHVVGEYLAIGGSESQQAPKLLRAFGSCHLLCVLVVVIARRVRTPPNDPSSATRPTRASDCNQSAMAGFAAAPG